MTRDVEGPSWVLPRGLTSFGAAQSEGSLYVLGGYFGLAHEYSEAGQTGALLRLDLESGEWMQLGEVGKAQSVALVSHAGRVVRIGGMQARNEAGTPADLHSLDTVEAFDVDDATWATWPSLPEPRSSHDAIVIDDAVWVVGGWTLDGEQRRWHDTALRLDLSAPAAGWTEVDVPFRRRALAAATAGGRLVAMGGLDEGRSMSSAVDVYDPVAGAWSEGPPFPGSGFGVAAASTRDAIYASGMDGVVYRWRPGEPSWEATGTLAFPRFFHRIVPTPAGELLAVGGMRDMKSGTRVRPIERISPESTPAEISMLVYGMRSPLSSRNRQGIAILGDTVFMFGGNKSLGQHDFGPEFFTDQGQALNLATLRWRAIAPYPERRQTMSAFVTEWGQIVSVGGFGHDGEVARSHPELFAYHPKKDRWRPIGRLPDQGRTQFGLAVREQQVVLFGGLDYDPRRAENERFRHERGLLQAPLAASGVDFIAADIELREPRRAFAGALLGDRYYLVGGMKEGFELVDTCEVYDFSRRAWGSVTCPSHARLSAQMVAMNGKLYLAAGSSRDADGLKPDPSLEVYDPSEDRWTMLVPELPIEPKHLSMLVYGDRLVMVSTHNDDGRVDVLLVDPPGGADG